MTTHVIDRLQQLVEVQPESIAIACAGEPAVTYAALWQRAHEVAALLGDARVVALHLEKSPEFVIGMLATWIAGAAWVPVLPELPELRRQLIVDETRAAVALVASDRTPPWLAERCRVIDLRSPSALLDERIEARSVEDLAYIIYTSGSTGQPKGVLVSHRGLVPMLDAQIAAFDLHAGDRCLWMLSPGFDASVSDVGTALLAGATLCIEHPAKLRSASGVVETIRRRGITHVDLPPSLLPLLPVDSPPSLRTIVVGGEVCAPAAIRAWAARVRVVNVYGPTEATVCTSLIVCDATWDRPLLGTPLPHVELAVVDDELWITGPGVADGYLDRPALDAAKFVHRDGRRWFRTGDRVRELESQARSQLAGLEFVGRIDRQLKIAGVLVAPEEVEARLREHPGVLDAHVVAEQVGTRDRLVAYYAAIDELADLHEHLASRLDARLIPARFVRADLGDGKRAPAAEGTHDADREQPGFPAPHGPGFSATQIDVATIWRRLLDVEPALVDDFFALGGDSLTVIEHVGLAELAGLPMTAEMLYEHRTLGALAAAIDRGATVTPMTCGALIADVAVLRETCRAIATSVRGGAIAIESVDDERDASVRGGAIERHAHDSEPSIVLTGATGFLGSRVLVELVARSDASITCLVRDPTTLIPVLRDLVDGDLAIAAMTSRVRVLAGDLVEPQLGLSPALYDQLTGAHAFVHCAADVSLAKPYRELRAANVEGTARILELAALGGARVHHASTLSVFVGSDRAPSTLRETDALETATCLHGGYAQSKWAAEWLAREAGASIYRFGLLTGDTRTGRAPARDWLTWFLRGLARVGAVPRGADQLAVDITPIDHASAVLAALVLDEARGTFHIANRRSTTLAELVAALRRAGLDITETDNWTHAVGTAELDAPEAAAALLGLCRTHDYGRMRACDVFQATGHTFDTSRTDEIATCPPTTSELLDRYVAELVR